MNSSANKKPSMIPALSPNGLAGIVPGIGIKHKNFNGCLSLHQVLPPIVYFCLKNEGFFPLEKSSSNTGELSESIYKWRKFNMKILVIDDLLQEKIHNALNKEGYTMMYILEPQMIESYIMEFEPDIVLIRSDSNSCKGMNLIMDINDAFPGLPIVFYNMENDESLNELNATVKRIVHDLNTPSLPLKRDKQFHHQKSLVR